MGKTVWMVAGMGLFTMLALSMGMMMTLGQFQETPAAEWVKLAEQTGRQFKANPVSIRVNLRSIPRVMILSYSSLVDSHYDLSFQNKEMEDVAKYVLQNYKEMKNVDVVQVTRSETHGRGCFQQTFVSHLTYQNPDRKDPNLRFTSEVPPTPQR